MTRAPHFFHPSPDGDGGGLSASSSARRGIDAATARKFESGFIAGVKNGLKRVRALPSPLEGTLYDFDAEREFSREWDEREEAKRQVKRAGNVVKLDAMPTQRVMQYSIVRRSLFSSPKPRLSIIIGCTSPIELLAKGPLGEFEGKGSLEAIEAILRAALVFERSHLYHYVAVCSTTGWKDQAYRELPWGENFSVALVEPRGPGWATFVPPDWPPPLANAIEPEDLDAKRARVAKVITTSTELTAPGGLLLLEEICERTVAPHELATEVAVQCANRDPSLVVEMVEGSVIVRRRR